MCCAGAHSSPHFQIFKEPSRAYRAAVSLPTIRARCALVIRGVQLFSRQLRWWAENEETLFREGKLCVWRAALCDAKKRGADLGTAIE
jgi:hypothetical protein